MRVLMVGRRRSVAFEDLKRYWGDVVFARPPRVPLGRYDLVVAQEPTPRVGAPAWLAARASRARLVVEVHGDYLDALPRAQRALALQLIRRADCVRAVNSSIAAKLRAHGAKKVLLIPSIYVDLTLFKPLKPHGLRPKRIIYAGRFVEEKNLDALIEAFRRVQREVEDAYLTLVGDGPLRPSLERLLKPLRNAEIRPWLPARSLPELYSDSAVFALASKYEGGPRAVFEAGACLTPFASTRVGILAETARHGVHGFFADDPGSLAERIAELLADTGLRERMGRELRRLVEERFEWGAAVRRYAEAYLKLLEGG